MNRDSSSFTPMRRKAFRTSWKNLVACYKTAVARLHCSALSHRRHCAVNSSCYLSLACIVTLMQNPTFPLVASKAVSRLGAPGLAAGSRRCPLAAGITLLESTQLPGSPRDLPDVLAVHQRGTPLVPAPSEHRRGDLHHPGGNRPGLLTWLICGTLSAAGVRTTSVAAARPAGTTAHE